MIEKYTNFINDKLVDLLLEGSLLATPDFISKLKSIKKDSEIANSLYKIFDEEFYFSKNLPQNYIDISDKDDLISFLPDTKAYDADDDSELYSAKGRGEIKIGRFAKSLLTRDEVENYVKKFSDKDYEVFVNLYKASKVSNEFKFKLVTGKDIKKYYNEDCYINSGGQLGASCMRYDDCEKYFKIYTKNTDSCSLLIYVNSKDEISGRAIVWKLDKSPYDSKFLMDRVYTSNDSDVIKFKNYAKSNGWGYKYKNSSTVEDSFIFTFNEKNYIGEAYVKLEEAEFSRYPFLDTLGNVNVQDKILSNVFHKNSLMLSDTDGGYDTCDSCYKTGLSKVFCLDYFKSDHKIKDCDKCNSSGQIEVPCKYCIGQYKESLIDIINSGSYPKDIVSIAKNILKKEFDYDK